MSTGAGAQASPLQCISLADSCLALGAASCQQAIQASAGLTVAPLLGWHMQMVPCWPRADITFLVLADTDSP